MGVTVTHDDCLNALHLLPTNSVHSIVTDPPYNLKFMGKGWDGKGIAFNVEMWRECLRVLKPGGHLVSFGGTRTYHRMASAIEYAGFDIRDSITWLYGSGFPKSRNVAEDFLYDDEGWERWYGFGTALKPASEPICVARKPFKGTLAANLEHHGAGAINIDDCRVATNEDTRRNAVGGENGLCGEGTFKIRERFADDKAQPSGRWPTNVVLSHGEDCGEDKCADGCPVAELDRQSGIRPGGNYPAASSGIKSTPGAANGTMGGGWSGITRGVAVKTEDGGASRFFPVFRYQAKAPTKERPKVNGVAHPTVKPLALIQWLCRLVTPIGGTVLDPFAGSGTTAEACLKEKFDCIVIESDETYIPLIQSRISRAGA